MAIFVPQNLSAAHVVTCVLILAIYVAWRNFKNYWTTPPFPPGPPPKLFIGNLCDFPTVQPWITYTRWKYQYGNIVYANAFGQHVVILNSLKAVIDLFEKRSQKYSDRPVLPMRDILGWKFVVGLMYYGDEWRKNRRILHQRYKPDAALAYRPIQMAKIHELLRNLLEDPSNFQEHYKYMAASIIMATVYGYESAPKEDPFIKNGDKAITMMTNAMFPGASVVNALPFLKYLPKWVPGSQFHRDAEECRALTRNMLDLPYEFVKDNMSNGRENSSLISELIEINEKEGGSTSGKEMIKGLGATSYSGTIIISTHYQWTFFYASAVNPEARRKAQEEIDRVIGGERLPDFNDRPSLPYVEAFYREVMRWRPAMPMGVAHSVTEDDIYEGYFIPKGATIMSNIWAMTRDLTKYPEPEAFRPERFLSPDGKLNNDDTILTFGFGRRLCIGRHAADSTIWATIVSVLAVFNFDLAKDIDGNAVSIEGIYTDALISHVLSFQCFITPRTVQARHLILEID
ncbi:cytochrome P450 [Crucibulum laeve]|uniref:Cytochrome P450 n=1 Tax=Crucibulum laeve TaxID=68775 RepID=A0A5C3LRD2_9AGAR|nr:cytochrome P450 [Crucibulum laeve]